MRLQIIPALLKILVMDLVKIENDGDMIHVTCPTCGNCESLPVDEQRHHLREIGIIDWIPDVEGKNQVSINSCNHCGNKFKVEWSYENMIEKD